DTEEDTEEVEEEAAEKISVTSGLKKYVLLGAIAGIFIPAFFIALVYILSGTVKTVSEIKDIFNYYIMGDFSADNYPNGARKGIDGFIDRLKNKNVLSHEENVSVSVANIKISCKKKDVDKVVLATAGIPSDSDKERFEEIVSALASVGIKAEYYGNAINDARVFEQIANVGNVVVCEKVKASSFKDIIRFNEICNNQASEILGALML
nr:hypothetical protein [Eubacterium sp.]